MEKQEIKQRLQEILDSMNSGLSRKTGDEFNPSENRFNEISNLSDVAFKAVDNIEKLIAEI